MPDGTKAPLPTIDSHDLEMIANSLSDAVTGEMEDCFQALGPAPLGSTLEARMARDCAALKKMAAFYEEQSRLARADEKAERRELSMLNADWRASRGC